MKKTWTLHHIAVNSCSKTHVQTTSNNHDISAGPSLKMDIPPFFSLKNHGIFSGGISDKAIMPSSFKAFAKRFLQFVRHWTSSTLVTLGSDFFDRHSSKMRQQASGAWPMDFPGKIGTYQTCQIMWGRNFAHPILREIATLATFDAHGTCHVSQKSYAFTHRDNQDLEAWCVLKTIQWQASNHCHLPWHIRPCLVLQSHVVLSCRFTMNVALNMLKLC